MGQEKQVQCAVCDIGVRLMAIVKQGGRVIQSLSILLLLTVSTHIFWLFYKAMFIRKIGNIMVSSGHSVLKPRNKVSPFSSSGSANLGPLLGWTCYLAKVGCPSIDIGWVFVEFYLALMSSSISYLRVWPTRGVFLTLACSFLVCGKILVLSGSPHSF